MKEDKRNSRRLPDNYSQALGKIPPQAIDVEQQVIGTLMLYTNSIIEIYDVLFAQAFYKEQHQLIYQAIRSIYEKGSKVDILTVRQELLKMEKLDLVGGAYALTGFTQGVGSDANIEVHARIIIQKYIERELIRVGAEAIRSGYEESVDVFDKVDAVAHLVQQTQETLIGKKINSTISESAEALFQKIYNHDHNAPSGIPSGCSDLDKLTGGWQNGELSIIMARPGMGKSSWLIESIITATNHGKRVAVFSIEMSSESFIQRIFSNMSCILHDKLKNRKLNGQEMEELRTYKDKVKEMPLHICDESRVNTQTIKTYIRSINRSSPTPIEILFVDYLQMVKVPDGIKFSNRDAEVTAISRDLKAISKEFNIPVVVVSSMNRDAEKRADKRPEMSDARDSGSIESDADLIIGLYRPSVYCENAHDNRDEVYREMEQSVYEKIAEVIVLKQRSGACGTIWQEFDGSLFKFSNYVKMGGEAPF